MSNRLETLLERMPRHFAHDPDSNNYRLLKILAQHSEDNRALYDTVLKYWDVDQAEGVALDRLGKDEGINRGGWDDEEYRKMIKIQCIVNLSEGDIDVMDQILDAYMSERFIGIEDGWKHIEPASILGRVKSLVGHFPDGLIKRIKPAGVRFYWLIEMTKHTLTLRHFRYNYPLYYGLCGVMVTDPIMGVGVGSVMTLRKNMYDYPIYYSPTDTINTEPILGVGVGSEFLMRDSFASAPLYYPATNISSVDGIKGHQGKFDTKVTHQFNQMISPYPVCGEFKTGGIV